MVPRQYDFMKIFEHWRDHNMLVVWKWAVLQDFKIRCYFAILPHAHFPPYNLVMGMILTVRSYQNFLEENVKNKWKTDVLRKWYGASTSFFTYNDRDIRPTREAHIYVNGEFYSEGLYTEAEKLHCRLAPFSIPRVFPRNKDLLEKDNIWYIFLT